MFTADVYPLLNKPRRILTVCAHRSSDARHFFATVRAQQAAPHVDSMRASVWRRSPFLVPVAAVRAQQAAPQYYSALTLTQTDVRLEFVMGKKQAYCRKKKS